MWLAVMEGWTSVIPDAHWFKKRLNCAWSQAKEALDQWSPTRRPPSTGRSLRLTLVLQK